MARGFGTSALSDGSAGGMTGSPTNVEFDAIAEEVLFEFCLKLFEMVLSVFFCRKGRIYSRSVSC